MIVRFVIQVTAMFFLGSMSVSIGSLKTLFLYIILSMEQPTIRVFLKIYKAKTKVTRAK